MLTFTGERIVPQADNCEPLFALKMFQEHIARYLFAAQVCAGQQVLDVGCGVGYGAHLLARHGASRVTAFDLSEAAVLHAREFYAHPKIRYLVASAEEFAFTETFGLITCFELIEHVRRQHRAVELLAAALQHDGVLIISTPRPTGRRRSDFHTRELALADFSSLLETYFPYVEWFFENNHFASLVASERPTVLEAPQAMHDQFNLGQADYFIAVASHSPVVKHRFRPQLVLNDDHYVRNLEKDVGILHRAQADSQAQLAVLTEDNSSLKSRLEISEAGRVSDAAAARSEIQAARSAVAARERDLQEARTRIAEEARLRDQAIHEGEALRSQLASLQNGWTQMDAWRTSMREEVEMWRKRAQSLQDQLDEIRRSGSWRITAPLRSALDLVIAGRKRLNGTSASEHSTGTTTVAPPVRTFLGKTRFNVMYVIGCHEGESKRYRVHNLVDGLRVLGYDAAAIADTDAARLIQSGVQVNTLVLFRSGDTANTRDLMAWAHQRNISVAFDVDDLIFEPESVDLVRVVSTFSEQDRAQYLSGVEEYRKVLLAADFVTCPTAFLADRIEQLGKTVAVIPNCLSQAQVDLSNRLPRRPPREGSPLRIGYFSGSNTHQVDFKACEEALLAILERHSQCRFVLVGMLDLGPEWDRFSDRIERHPMMPYDQMLELLASIDINLAPLEIGNPYCESKSQLKIFEAGIVSVPTIASGTVSYREAIEHGVDGLIAANMLQWDNALETLICDSNARQQMGAKARERALRQYGPEAAAKAAEQAYGLPPAGATVQVNSRDSHAAIPEKLKISWIVPGLIIGSGGHRNILRAAYFLQRFGHDIELYFTATDLTELQLAESVQHNFYPLDCAMNRYRGIIHPTDVLLATHWSTVDIAMRGKDAAGQIMYFVQDFEPAFYPMGTDYVLAENTYRLGLYLITSGPWCAHVLRREYRCEADHFIFPIDKSVYHPRPRAKAEKNILFFAKPEMPRRCFELGTMALEQLHRLRPDVEIILFGSRELERLRAPFPATVCSLLPSIEDLALLYANADLGIVFSTTNPSLVPYEMMACGLPVVDLGRPGNEINYAGRNDIALLTDPSPAAMARQIADLLDNAPERAERSRNGLEFVESFPSEEQMARRVETLIFDRLKATNYKRKPRALERVV